MSSIMVIDEADGRKIHQYFDLLYRNRLLSDAPKKVRGIPKEPNSFKPAINPDSEVMASRYRDKMIDKTNTIFSENKIDIQLPKNGLSHEDFLVIHSLGQNLEKQKIRQLLQKSKDPECTFQPNAEKYPQELLNPRMAEDKCRSLYEGAKARQDETSRLPTFRENLSNTPNKNPSSPVPKSSHSRLKPEVKSYLEIKDVDKTLSRMMSGRQQRNERQEMKERGEKLLKRIVNKPPAPK
jgi:hypothetical protein